MGSCGSVASTPERSNAPAPAPIAIQPPALISRCPSRVRERQGDRRSKPIHSQDMFNCSSSGGQGIHFHAMESDAPPQTRTNHQSTSPQEHVEGGGSERASSVQGHVGSSDPGTPWMAFSMSGGSGGGTFHGQVPKVAASMTELVGMNVNSWSNSGANLSLSSSPAHSLSKSLPRVHHRPVGSQRRPLDGSSSGTVRNAVGTDGIASVYTGPPSSTVGRKSSVTIVCTGPTLEGGAHPQQTLRQGSQDQPPSPTGDTLALVSFGFSQEDDAAKHGDGCEISADGGSTGR